MTAVVVPTMRSQPEMECRARRLRMLQHGPDSSGRCRVVTCRGQMTPCHVWRTDEAWLFGRPSPRLAASPANQDSVPRPAAQTRIGGDRFRFFDAP